MISGKQPIDRELVGATNGEKNMLHCSRFCRRILRACGLVACVLMATPLFAGPEAQTSHQGISREEYIARMNHALDDMIVRTSAPAKQPITFSFNLFYAHSAVIENMPLATLTKAVDAMVEAGVERVDINMGLFPWATEDEDTIAKYDALIHYLREQALQLAINPQYTATADGKMSFSEWQRKALSMYGQVARRYHPEILTVIHEPTTIAARFGERIRPRAWAKFAQQAIRVVKRASPRTKTSVGVLSWEKTYFNAFLRMKGLDEVGIDIYNLRGMAVYDQMIKQAHAKGLPVHIEETWRNPYFDPRQDETLEDKSAQGIGDARYQDLDIKWLTAMTQYANTRGLDAVTPFWMQAFFLYVNDAESGALDAEYNRRVTEAIIEGRHTKTLAAYRALIKRY